MDRKEAKELMPIIQAFSEGKEIEGLYKGTKSPWFKIKDMNFNEGIIFRIKPEPTYRPFKDVEECWMEMQKHQPFGWLKSKKDGYYSFITMLNYRFRLNGYDGWRFDDVINKFTFADGTTFGVKVEE